MIVIVLVKIPAVILVQVLANHSVRHVMDAQVAVDVIIHAVLVATQHVMQVHTQAFRG